MGEGRVLLQTLGGHVGEQVEVAGWVMEDRDLGGVRFLSLMDRTGRGQIVLKGVDTPSFGRQSVVSVAGQVVANSRAVGGAEVVGESLSLLAPVLGNPPLDPARDEPSLEMALAHRMLSLRKGDIHTTFEVQAALTRGFRSCLESQGFTEVHTPKIVGSGTEGGANLFPLRYFGRQAYLAQSPQFYKEMLVGAGFERVFEVGPVFRAETHDTARHLNEYTSLDLEVGFIGGVEDLLRLETGLLCRMLEEAEPFARHPFPVLPKAIPVMTFREAQALVERSGRRLDGDLDPESERELSTYVGSSQNGGWVFVTGFPSDRRPFYALPSQEAGYVESFDLICAGLEVTTGGMRQHLHRPLTEAIERHHLDPDSFGAYLDAHRWGLPPHGGLAIGLERLTARLLGLPNVREATLFPRDRSRLAP